MKVRKLIWLISLAILGIVLPLVASHQAAISTSPVLRADGTAPVPPPPPLPPAPGPSSIIACALNSDGADILEPSSSLCAIIPHTSPVAAASAFEQTLWRARNAAEALPLLRSFNESLHR